MLSVVPPGSHVTLRQKVEPDWDSCDGRRDTYGWDPAEVDVDWKYVGNATRVLGQVEAGMRSLGWIEHRGAGSGGAGFGELSWHKTLTDGAVASALLLGGPGSDPPDWSLQADVPAATHPVRGC